jgi:uncharacterized protein
VLAFLEQHFYSMKDKGLIIFIKNSPEAKTRIAETNGKEVAKNIYQQLKDELKVLCSNLEDIDIHLFYSDAFEENDEWSKFVHFKHLQKNGDLGYKMKNAFHVLLEYYNKVIIIGSDCPTIQKKDMDASFKALIHTDLVLGPALDGGYYLLGFKKMYSDLFSNIEWSTNSVLNQTIDKAYQLGLSIYKHELFNDIDYYEDYLKWISNKKP